MIVAIDGPAASGKGTLARLIGAHLGLPVLDTGLLYRAVARAMVEAGADLGDEARAAAIARGLKLEGLDEAALRGAEAGEAASVVAAYPAVRAALVELQRAFAARPGGAVLDGRDIGTVIAPDADRKIFVTATAEERARRRHGELMGRGENVSYDAVLADIRARDARDSARTVSPLRQADDAVLLDTTELDIDAAFRAALAIIESGVAVSART